MKTILVAMLAVLGPALGAANVNADGSEFEACAQDASTPGAETQPGLKVGEKAPRFTLKDGAGKERSLDELLAKGKVALVFYRSADW
jgi:cytochrome oxidase Cu insertion factor (SCO1/SenC/PrrC family)